MMNYKRLGDYIQKVDVRNKSLEDLPLMGVSNTKVLIPSIANTIGTDMSKYKIIEKRQFAYGTVTSRNGDRLSIALLEKHEKALISQIYVVFEVMDTEQLLPEYLMMWFSRPEFDRYTRFHSRGSTRETFDWEDMCEVILPIPTIEKQRAIVAQYQAVADKIKVNEQICEKLEATAQALYKQWFVKGIDEENLPSGWKIKSLSDIAKYKNGLAMQNFPYNDYLNSFGVIKIRELGIGKIDENSDRCTNEIPEEVIVYNGDVVFSWSGTLKIDIWSGETAGLNQHLFKVTSKDYPKWYYYYSSKFHLVEFIRIADSNKTSLGHIKREHLENAKVFVPTKEELQTFSNMIKDKFDYVINIKNQNQKLVQLQSLLLSRLVREE